MSENQKNIVITGSEGLLGSSFIKNHASDYNEIFSIDIHKKNKKNYYKCDVTNESQVKKVINKVTKNNNVDVLINYAAYNPPAKKKMKPYKFSSYSLKDWKKNISIDLIGSFLMSKYILKHFEKKNSGTIINISSVYGLKGIDQSIYNKNLKRFHGYKPIEYSVAKSGIIGFTKSLSTFYKNTNIKILCLILGGVEKDQGTFFKKNYNKKAISSRMARIDEYNEYIKFYSSDKASYSTGTCVVIDGGATNLF
mgnify:CR=1 FL=1|tara:strand:- start:57 stop:812 length:756 start_codon:yes stop_codon:yes gene_type:complete